MEDYIMYQQIHHHINIKDIIKIKIMMLIHMLNNYQVVIVKNNKEKCWEINLVMIVVIFQEIINNLSVGVHV